MIDSCWVVGGVSPILAASFIFVGVVFVQLAMKVNVNLAKSENLKP